MAEFFGLNPPIPPRFLELARRAESEVTIVAPFITTFGVKTLLQGLREKPMTLRIYSRFDRAVFLQRSSDLAAFEMLDGWSPQLSSLPLPERGLGRLPNVLDLASQDTDQRSILRQK